MEKVRVLLLLLLLMVECISLERGTIDYSSVFV